MSLRDHVSVNAVYLRLMVRLLQVGFLGIVFIGFIQFN